jgi:hypothetical protein
LTETTCARSSRQLSKSDTEIARNFRSGRRDRTPIDNMSAVAVNDLQKALLGQRTISFSHSVEVYSEVDCETPHWRQRVTGFEHTLYDESAQLANDLPPRWNAATDIQSDLRRVWH